MVASKEWVDFKQVKEAVGIEKALAHYGISLNSFRATGEELRGPCPIQKQSSGQAFRVNLTKNAFQCFSCKARGNVLDFVAKMEGCTIRDAALLLAEWFKVGDRGEQNAGNSVPATGGDVALMICLQGDVLAQAGFGSGDRYSIECAPGRITLVKVEDSS